VARLPPLEAAPVGRRYEWERPGQLVHVDIKKLGRIGGIGHRITGDRRQRVRGIGWEFVHVSLDDCSRLAYAEVLRDEQSVTVAGFLRRAVAWFARRGVHAQRVLSDNGSAYRSRLVAAACQALTLDHRFTRPYTPRTNGKAERFVQTPCASGRTRSPTRPRRTAPPRCTAGCITTIGIGRTRRFTANRLSAESSVGTIC
jgi:transposase InsO family protein